MKKCRKCGETKELKEFYTDKGGKYGVKSRCKSCQSIASREYNKKQRKERAAYTRRYYRENKEKIKARYAEKYDVPLGRGYMLKKKYDMSLEEYDKIHESQNGLCAICGNPETKIHSRSKKVMMLAVDHCHKTGKGRGLLCSRCNTTLGKIEDDKEILNSMLDYLNRYSE